jgi:drug/metabolite transporter (DMT)-like permease
METGLTNPAHSPSRFQPSRHGIGRPEAALIAVSMIWGATFLVVQNALSVSTPFVFVAMRFGTAALLLALIAGRTLAGLTWLEIKAGALIGAAMMVGYSLQTIGLETILSSTSGFLTALYVPIVPLLQWALLRQPPSLPAWIGVGLAFIGLVLIAGPDGAGFQMGYGEFVTVLCAVAFAAEIILIGAFAGRLDARRVTVVQLAAASMFATIAAPMAGEPAPVFSWLLASTVIGMALASAAIQLTMNWAQKTVSPTRATIIYASEPVWAGLFGRLAGETLLPRAIFGCGLIVAAVIASQWRSGKPASHQE